MSKAAATLNERSCSASQAKSASHDQDQPVRSRIQTKAERETASKNTNDTGSDGMQQAPVTQPVTATQESNEDAQDAASNGANQGQAISAAGRNGDSRLNNLQKAGLQDAAVTAASFGNELDSAQALDATDADDAQVATSASAADQAANGSSAVQGTAAGLVISAGLAAADAFAESMVLPQGGDAHGSAAKAGQSKNSNSISGTNTTGANPTAAAGTSKGSAHQDSSSGTHGAQANGQSLQQQQADALQTMVVAARTGDGNAAQTVAFAAHVAAGQSGHAESMPSTAGNAPVMGQAATDALREPWDGTATAGAQGINTARVLQSMSETEMRVGMHSTEFGEISIRTSVSQQQVQAQISVDHSELGSTISAHIPALQAKLGDDFGLHTNIEVSQAGGFLAGGQGQSSQQHSQAVSPSFAGESVAPVTETESLTMPVLAGVMNDCRLDIRA